MQANRQERLGVYDYWPYEDRPKIRWPRGARVAFWVAPNVEYYELDPPTNPQRKPWPTPHPSVPGFSIRDYGNRVGHQRQMALLDKYGIRGSVSLSVALCEHHPEIIEMCCERDWEFFSHGVYNTRYTYGTLGGAGSGARAGTGAVSCHRSYCTPRFVHSHGVRW